ncbi:MAG: TatD family hydrolase [Pseudomonadota bacterium]
MNSLQPEFVDSHVHLDLVYAYRSDRIEWLRRIGCLPISWAFSRYVGSVADLKVNLNAQQKAIHTIRSTGLECFYLTGVHPRNIPPDLVPEKIADILAPFLEDPVCLGIGEIGLEFGGQQEKEILAAQLSMAPEVSRRKKILGLHTPRNDKQQITQEILSVLEDFQPWCSSIVVDHCLPETIEAVLKQGFWAGITLSPVKASHEDLDQIIKHHPEYVNRMLLNTDSGSKFNEDLYRLYLSEPYPDDIQSRLFRDNALCFFQINPDFSRV